MEIRTDIISARSEFVKVGGGLYIYVCPRYMSARRHISPQLGGPTPTSDLAGSGNQCFLAIARSTTKEKQRKCKGFKCDPEDLREPVVHRGGGGPTYICLPGKWADIYIPTARTPPTSDLRLTKKITDESIKHLKSSSENGHPWIAAAEK